jgi:hypothetical protein
LEARQAQELRGKVLLVEAVHLRVAVVAVLEALVGIVFPQEAALAAQVQTHTRLGLRQQVLALLVITAEAVVVVVRVQAIQHHLVARVAVEMVVFMFLQPLLPQQQAQPILVVVAEEPLAMIVAPLEALVLF